MKTTYLKISSSLQLILTTGTLILLLFVTACQPQASNGTGEKNSNNTTNESSESFHQIEQSVIDSLNKKIMVSTFTSVEEIPALCRPKQTDTEGNYSYTIGSHNLTDSTIELTLVELGLADDAVKGIKTVFLVSKKGNQYSILEMKENYQCYRGHSDWSAEKCN